MNFYRENKENFILFVADKKGQALNLYISICIRK